ncbi:xylulokinase [soil metagenome]
MLIGVDIGTQSLKVAVTDSSLTIRGAASRAYRPDFPNAGYAEQDPRLWENALGPAIAEALAAADASPAEVTALGICGQLDGCIPAGVQGEALGNCLIWMDRRAQDEMTGMPANRIHATCGIVADASHLAAKIRWLKGHAGDAGAIARFHQPVSYMVERLTGAAVIDHALASTTMLYSLARRRYDDELLSVFGIAESELPPIAEAHDRAGVLNAGGARLAGLPAGLTVAVGTGDDFSTPLGAGIRRPGEISVAIGTGEVVGGVFSNASIDPGRLVETHPYPAGGYFIENPGWLSGGVVVWLMEVLRIETFAAFDALAAEAPPGSAGLIFIPALTGAMSPEWIAGARGCFYGLTPSHGAAHLCRALLEGCSFAMRDVVDRLALLGAQPNSLTLLAGGSNSRLWARIRADTSGLPVTLPRYSHTSVIGAAMLAGVAAGVFASVPDAATALPASAAQIEPDLDASTALEPAYRRYQNLFAALKPIFLAGP